MKFAAVAGHRFGRATPSLRDAPQPQSTDRIGRESIYRDRNAVQTTSATADRAGEAASRGAPAGDGDRAAVGAATSEARGWDSYEDLNVA